MKIPNKREYQQTAINPSSDVDFMHLYKKCNAKPCSFLVNDTIPVSDNALCFRHNLLENKKELQRPF